MSDEIVIPPAFWRSLTQEQFASIVKTSKIEGELLERLWPLMGREDNVPSALLVYVSQDLILEHSNHVLSRPAFDTNVLVFPSDLTNILMKLSDMKRPRSWWREVRMCLDLKTKRLLETLLQNDHEELK